jgi:hypothetical protein
MKRISDTVRTAKKTFLKNNPNIAKDKKSILVLNKFIEYFFKTYAAELFAIDNRNLSHYIRGIIHATIVWVIIYILLIR